MNVNTAILDALTGHSVGLHRVSNATVRKIIALLNRSDARIIERLTMGGSDISRARQEQLLEDIRQIVAGLYQDATGALKADLDALAKYEGEFQLNMLKATVPVQVDWVAPSAYQLIAATNARPFQGKLLKDWFTELPEQAFARLRNAIRAGFVEGRTIDQMVREIRGTRAQGFKDGILEINRRAAEVTVRTATAHTANVARSELYQANSKFIKAVQWVSTLDGRTSAVCRGRDGQTYPVDSGPRPPAHPNCLPGDSLVLAGSRITGASKRWFEGEMVTVRTGNGREVSATPNHPILTVSGWKPIGLINEGDKLLCVTSPKAVAGVNAGDDDTVASIEDVTDAFFTSSGVTTMPVPTATPDFHGDGAGSEVAIVGAYSRLAVEGSASGSNEGGHLGFKRGSAGLGALLADGTGGQIGFGALDAPHGIMGGTGKGLTFFGASAVHASLLLLTPPPQMDAVFTENTLNGTWADAEFIRDAANTDAGSVFTDDVVSVERREFSGHVFNLETEKHVYYSMDIVIHNCRSTTTPVLKSLAELGMKGKDLPPGTRASMDGQVAADTNYDAWLRKKPQAYQDEILGKSKARLFREGLTLDRFVSRSGDELTLDELKQREAALWERTFSN